jgi:toxin ParE1/3/4
MARKVVWTSQSGEDLENIAEYISRDSEYYASSFVTELFNSIQSLNEFPERGRTVPELNDINIKEIFIKEYRVIYRIEEESVMILTIIHGRRNFPEEND